MKSDSELKDLTEPSNDDKSIFLKIILIVETLFPQNKNKNTHIGRYFSRWYDKQGTIDGSNENIKMKKVERDDLKFRLDDLKVEEEKDTNFSSKHELDTKQWEAQKIDDELENLK